MNWNHLVLLARRTAILDELAAEIRETGASATIKTIDFTDRGAWARTYQSLTDEGIEIDALYHCAVQISAGALHHTLPGDWEQIYRVNLLSTTSILCTLYQDMLKRDRGTIVLFSSLTSHSGAPMSAPYGATKTALYGMWRSLKYENNRTNVNLHLVSPGFVDTPLFENFILRKVTNQQMRQSMLATRVPITKPEVAARKIVEGVSRSRDYIVFPFRMCFAAFLVRRFPVVGKMFLRHATRAMGIDK
ncbi:MAG: SDR family NAD(P)-dependent oxidoreductase [Akkermansiaceae bacterium]